MVKVSVEVRSRAHHFRVGVRAESIRRALGAVAARYPTSEVRVTFPIEPDGFFAKQRWSSRSNRSKWRRENDQQERWCRRKEVLRRK